MAFLGYGQGSKRCDIRAAVSALGHEAIQGGLLAVLVILLFLASFRATGIIAVAIPLSTIATFVLLYSRAKH